MKSCKVFSKLRVIILCITNLLEYFLFVIQCSGHNDGGDVIVIYINNIICTKENVSGK